MFPNSKVYCFEPQLDVFNTLLKFIKTNKYNNVVCENIGLDKFNGTKYFYSLNNTTQSTSTSRSTASSRTTTTTFETTQSTTTAYDTTTTFETS